MGRDVADTMLLLSSMVGFDARDPQSYDADPAAFRTPDPVDLGSLRVAWSADLGFAVIDSGIRKTFADRIGRIAGAFARCFERDPEMANANETFAVLRATSFVSAQKANHEKHPDLLGPNVRANYEEGLGYTAQEVGLAQMEQTRIYRAFQALFDDCDLFVCPTNGVPPFSLDRLYPEEIDGRKLQTYFHWMAPCYGITLTASPAISIPCGLDHTGTPFGLQLVARRGRDKFLLDAAHALYQHLQTTAETARPLPDLDSLAAARAA
jgi:Asp-tRNA(Asn)/Glu-tRNA(Gln) amidotransferase A subunit family amidase